MAWCCYLSALSAFKLPALQPETRLLSTSLWGAEREGGSHSSRSVPRPASLDATRQRATSFSHPFFRFVPRKHKNHVSSGHRGSSQSSSQLLFTYVLALISASACVCSFVYEHGASVCVCMGVLVALVWRSQSLRVPALLSRSCVKAGAQMTDMSI